MVTSARAIAFQILVRAERTDAYLNLMLDAALKSAPRLTPPDRALITELVYGTTRHQRTLDATIAVHASRALERLDPEIRVALRLGVYQLFFMRMKPYAAVNETVELIKTLPRCRHATSFVNALLRSMERTGALQEFTGTPEERLAIECSQPTWLVERWVLRFGLDETAELCHAQNQTPKIDVRINPNRISREALIEIFAGEGISAQPTPYSPIGLQLDPAGNIAKSSAFSAGLFQIQDTAAQLVGLLPRVEKGIQILDACAAPGSKACHLAERLQGDGRVYALDLHEHKLRKLREEAKRLGLEALIETKVADASAPLPFEETSFDIVLADVPCTGLGTLRRHPEIRYRRAPDDPARMAKLQRDIVENLVRYLKPGGQLVYSVCSMEVEEGLGQLDAFESLGLLPVMPDDGETHVLWPIERVDRPCIATFPHRQDCDGFFGVRMIRQC